MPVSQRFIDLLNAPMPVLRRVAADHDLEGLGGLRKWELAQRLAALTRGDLEDATGQFLYAGSTSLSWLRIVRSDTPIDLEDPQAVYPLRGAELSVEDVLEALRHFSEGDPFSETERPAEISPTDPKLVVARRWDDDDGYILTFAVAKRLGHVIHNFEQSPVLEDEFFTVLLRPAAGSVEVRSSAGRARLLARTWLGDVAHSLGCVTAPVSITQADAEALHDELGGRLDVFRGKTTTGTTIFDTQEYTKAPDIADMLGEEEFDRTTAGLEPISMDLLFDAPDFGEVRMHVSVINGSIFIRTAVPERIIRYVREVLERIKGGNAGRP